MRRSSYLLAAVAACLALAAPAQASRWPLPPRFPTITYAPCPDLPQEGGCAYGEPDGDTCVDPNGCIFLIGHARFSKWHELGHIFDRQVLTERDRLRFVRLLGFRVLGVSLDLEWARGPSGTRSPAEFFADAYAQCALRYEPPRMRHGRLVGRVFGSYGFAPSWGQYRRVCHAIRFVALG